MKGRAENWKQLLVANVLGRNAWDDQDAHVARDAVEGFEPEDFASAGVDLLAELRSGHIVIAASESVRALSETTASYAKYLDPALSVRAPRIVRLVLWGSPDHVIELRGRDSDWDLLSGNLDSVLDSREDASLGAQFEPDDYDSAGSYELQIAELQDALRETRRARVRSEALVAASEHRVDALSMKLERLQDQLELDRRIRQASEHKVSELEALCATLRDDKQAAAVKSRAERDRSKGLALEKRSARKEIRDLKTRLRNAESSTQRERAARARLKSELEQESARRMEHEAQPRTVVQNLQSHETELQALEWERRDLADQVAQAREKASSIAAALMSEMSPADTPVQELDSLEAELDAVDERVSELNRELRSSRDELAAKAGELDSTTKAADEACAELAALLLAMGRVVPRRFIRKLGIDERGRRRGSLRLHSAWTRSSARAAAAWSSPGITCA